MYSDIGDNWLIILILTLICSVGYLLLAKHKALRSFASPLTNPNILVVHGARPGSTVVDPTLFVLKLQTFLRIAKISYVHDYTRPRDRKGRIPWIELNGKEHYDSTLIIEYLTEKFNITIDDQLTRKQKALARTIQKMIEGNTAWYYKQNKAIIDRILTFFQHKF